MVFGGPLVVTLLLLYTLVLTWAIGGYPSVVWHLVSGHLVITAALNVLGYVGLAGVIWLIRPALKKAVPSNA